MEQKIMKKIIREVNEKAGIVQVTIADERWYLKQVENKKTGIPDYLAVPSVTWIAGSYPKGVGFYKWLAEKGWDESEAIKNAAGNKGSKIHEAIADILQGNEVRIDSKYLNKETGQLEELTLEECDAILSFIDWKNEVKPEVIAWETTIFSEKYNYAGTVDFIAKIDGEVWIIDFKTGQYVWPEYELQVSAYRKAIEEEEHFIESIKGVNAPETIKTAILQVGYRKNKAGYKFTEIENKFPLFLAAQTIWQNDHGNEKPSKKDYPIVLSPALTIQDVMKGTDETEVELEFVDTENK